MDHMDYLKQCLWSPLNCLCRRSQTQTVGLNPHHVRLYAGEALGVLNLVQAVFEETAVLIHHALLD